MSDEPYFLDFLFNDIVNVHWATPGYLAMQGYAQVTDGFMRTWIDGIFFDPQPTANFAFGYDETTGQINLSGLTGSIRITTGLVTDMTIKASDLKGKLVTPNGGTLKNSFLIGVHNGTSNADLIAFVSLENFKAKSVPFEINTAPEQPVAYGVQLFTYKTSTVEAGKRVGDFLLSKAVSRSSTVAGGTTAAFTLNASTLKITNR